MAGHPNTIAPSLRKERLLRNLNTKDAGVVVGVSARTWEGWEQGRPLPLVPEVILSGFVAWAPWKPVPAQGVGRPLGSSAKKRGRKPKAK